MINKKIIIPIISSFIIVILCFTSWFLWYKSEILSNKIKFATEAEYEEKKKEGNLVYADDLEKSMNELDNINKNFTDIKSDNNDLSNKYSNLLEDNKSKSDVIGKTTKDINNLETNITNTTEDYSNNLNSKYELNNECSDVNSELSDSSSILESKSSEVDNLDNQIKDLVSQYDDLSNQCLVIFISNNSVYAKRYIQKNSLITDVDNPVINKSTCFIGWSIDKVHIISLEETYFSESTTLYAIFDEYALTENGNDYYKKISINYFNNTSISGTFQSYSVDIQNMILNDTYKLPSYLFSKINETFICNGSYNGFENGCNYKFMGYATDYENNSFNRNVKIFNSYSDYLNSNLNVITNKNDSVRLHNRVYGIPYPVFIKVLRVEFSNKNNVISYKSYFYDNIELLSYNEMYSMNQLTDGYMFMGWSTEFGNKDKIIDVSYLQSHFNSYRIHLYPIIEMVINYYSEPIPEAVYGGVTSVRPRQKESKVVICGQTFNLPNPESTPTHKFIGWSTSEDGSLIDVSSYKYSSNLVFYAIYDRYCVVNFKDTYIDAETSIEYTYQKTVYVKKGTTFDLSQYDWSDEIGANTWYIRSWNSRYFCYEFKTTIDLTTPFQVNSDTYISSKYYVHQSTGGGTIV